MRRNPFHLHRTLDRVDVPTLSRAVAAKVTPDFRIALGAAAVAIASLIVDGALGGSVHGSAPLREKLFTLGTTAGFLVFSLIAIRSVASEMYRVLKPRTGPSHAGVIRWVITLFGCAIALLTALGLLQVPIGHLLLGGALTGVIVGIAAQQSLGNVFAGVVLLLARPFNVGDRIRMRAGALSGELIGTVTGMGLTYVTVVTEDGPLSIPNSGVLAAVIGPAPRADVSSAGAADSPADVADDDESTGALTVGAEGGDPVGPAAAGAAAAVTPYPDEPRASGEGGAAPRSDETQPLPRPTSAQQS